MAPWGKTPPSPGDHSRSLKRAWDEFMPSQEWEEYAERCIEIARQTRDTIIREKLIEMAQRWMGKAAMEEKEAEPVTDQAWMP